MAVPADVSGPSLTSASAWAAALSGAGDGQRALRRSLGPTAWAVLADVCMDAQPDDAGVVVATSARRVAAQVGIAKDTAARALRRLTAAGILRRRPQGVGAAGRFTAGIYELRLPCAVAALGCRSGEDTVRSACPEPADTARVVITASPAQAPPAVVPAQRPKRTTIGSDTGQLSLLGLVAGAAEQSR